MSSNKMWGGRFGADPDPIMAEINASIDFDRHLYRQDIAASKADRKSTRLNSSHVTTSRMPSSA